MKDEENPQKTLQDLLNCYLETRPDEVLRNWADGGWAGEANVSVDETCLKYIALVLLDSIESRAEKTILEMGCPALVDSGDLQHMLPPAPESMVARGWNCCATCADSMGPREKACFVSGSEMTALS